MHSNGEVGIPLRLRSHCYQVTRQSYHAKNVHVGPIHTSPVRFSGIKCPFTTYNTENLHFLLLPQNLYTQVVFCSAIQNKQHCILPTRSTMLCSNPCSNACMTASLWYEWVLTITYYTKHIHHVVVCHRTLWLHRTSIDKVYWRKNYWHCSTQTFNDDLKKNKNLNSCT